MVAIIFSPTIQLNAILEEIKILYFTYTATIPIDTLYYSNKNGGILKLLRHKRYD